MDRDVRDTTPRNYMVGHDPAGSDLRSEFVRVLADDPAHKPASREYSPRSCVNLLPEWCTNAQHLVHAVEGRLAAGPV